MAQSKVFIAGAGGIGQAVGLMLRELGDLKVDLVYGDLTLAQAERGLQWVQEGSTVEGKLSAIQMPEGEMTSEVSSALDGINIVLDCLPGSQAPRMARWALKKGAHYVNITEYVAETNEIIELATGASSAFLLQAGLAPGFIDVLAMHLFNQFCATHQIDIVDDLSMKVGALTPHAQSPHYYGFTWSHVGVATEYVKPATVVRNFNKTTVPALSERSRIIIDGAVYEDDLTSGGAADLPDALASRVRNLDYKTLRWPGHYGWVDGMITDPSDPRQIELLQKVMEQHVPFIENDFVIVYCSVRGKDHRGVLRQIDRHFRIVPGKIGQRTLRAIQSTTAAGLAEAARLILLGNYHGPVLQSQINTQTYLDGPYVRAIYGEGKPLLG